MEPRAKLFLYDSERGGLFGDGRYELLDAVREHGSLQEAARRLGRGYRKAWEDIRKAEKALGRRLVDRSRGGRDGGSSRLTVFGTELLDAWKRYRRAVDGDIENAYERFLRKLVEGEYDE
ncbi:MAG: LysR family transcriptional regulator [Candidatus Krumholzibacteriota bacterium]|nr:LysR family transcriptional regulator [Candidatus Krumholzibacteriota bacterium]